jgi:transcriptional regulator with XRE-family HTH domain
MGQAAFRDIPVDFRSGHKMVLAAVLPPEETMAASSKKNGNGDGHDETFGQRLAALRKAAGYSQREFALEIGISHRMVAYYEAQTEHPPAHLLPTIAKALHLSTDQVLGLKPVQKRQPPLNQQLLRKMKKIEALPPRDQRPLLRTIDAYLRGAEKR